MIWYPLRMAEIVLTIDEDGERVYTNRHDEIYEISVQAGEAVTTMLQEGSTNLVINLTQDGE